MNSIPKQIAFDLCQEIRLEQITRWYAWFFSPCWNCEVVSSGIPAKMRVGDQPGYRGCDRVNARYQQQFVGRKENSPMRIFS